ncbi:hypothetical protein [Lonsdalea quercina]|uniref:hypothetical protein n=1 Tax=Lonsdalea quercina TaxID=71657 RepID=UPI003974C398
MTTNIYLRKILALACLIIATLISFYLSSRYFSADPDFLNSPIVWDEIKDHGFQVMKEWSPTVDNWYLSIYPIHFFLFWVFGTPTVLMLKIMATCQIVICSLLASLIIYKKTGNALSFLFIVFFSIISYYSYTIGFAFHLFSHNSINLYGLLCILIYISFDKSFAACIAICLILLASSISDPWLVVAYTLPFLILSLFDKLKEPNASWKFLIAYLVTLAIFFSHLIQNSLNIPTTQFQLVDVSTAFDNLKFFMIDAGWMNNLLFKQNAWAYVISSAIMIIVAVTSVFFGKKLTSINVLLIFSLLGVSSSFIIGAPAKDEISARFLANFIYLIPILICVNLNKKTKLFAIPFLLLSFISALYSHSVNNENTYDDEINKQIDFMQQHNLNFGYGAYWGTHSVSVTWMSKGNVTIVPVVVNHSDGEINWDIHRSQIFEHWYEPVKTRTFVAITPDSETCPSVELCLSGIQKQNGIPDNILKYRDITFFVYENGIHN